METVLDDYSKWLKGEKTPAGKIKVIEASLTLFSEQGFDGTSTKEIARESGMSEATIFKYFGSKENLLQEIISPIVLHILPDYRDEFLSIVNNNNKGSLKEVIHFIVRNRFEFLKENKRAILILSSMLLTNESIKNMFVELVKSKESDVLKTMNEAFNRSGEVREDLNPILIIRLLVSQIISYFIQCYKLFETPDEEQMERDLTQIEDSIYRAIKE